MSFRKCVHNEIESIIAFYTFVLMLLISTVTIIVIVFKGGCQRRPLQWHVSRHISGQRKESFVDLEGLAMRGCVHQDK